MSSAILAEIRLVPDVKWRDEITRSVILFVLEAVRSQMFLKESGEEPASYFAGIQSSKQNILLIKA
jgi:hypothetical protein